MYHQQGEPFFLLLLILDSRKNGFISKHETEIKSKGNYSSAPHSCNISLWHWQVMWPLIFCLKFFRKPPFMGAFRVVQVFRGWGQSYLNPGLRSCSESTPATGDKLCIYIFIEDQLSKVIAVIQLTYLKNQVTFYGHWETIGTLGT